MGTVMNLCPTCRESMAEFYYCYPVAEVEDWLTCGNCVYKRKYYGVPYEIESKKRVRARRAANYTGNHHAGENSKKETWREFRRAQRES